MAKETKKPSSWPYLLIALLVAIGVGVAWRMELLPPGLLPNFGARPAAAPEPPPPRPIVANGEVILPAESTYRTRVMVAPVTSQSVSLKHAYPATVEANPARTINVLPPLGGRVTELKVQLGEDVQVGQTLVAIESGDLAQAQADVQKAKASVDLTKRALDRAQNLAKIGGLAQKDLESALNDNKQAEAEQQRAEIRLGTIAGKGQIAGERSLLVNAPISGTITALATAAGAYINDPTQSMMTISNLDVVFVTANVPETDLSFVHENQDVQFSLIAYPGREFHGRVATLSGILDPDTRREKVRISYENPDHLLKPNMFAVVTFVPPPVDRILIPSSALLMVNDSSSVFVETKLWTFVRRKITLGSDVGDDIVVKEGLSAGERIVVRGAVLLND